MPQAVPLTFKRVLGNFFVLFVLFVIGSVYYVFMSQYKSQASSWGVFLLLCVIHFFLFMLMWSFVKAMVTDPGVVPPLWGFCMGDSEQKRRRYCLMCHVFKPERCHHCSACNRCVLGMDHHCPWINNCVGFYNRKYFLLLLIYVIISTAIVGVSLAKPMWDLVMELLDTRDFHNYSAAFRLGVFCLTITLNIVMTLFFKFHLRLLFTNKTTIENMDKKNTGPSVYDRGQRFNFLQVFGGNPWLWLLPLTGRSGKPWGDGVTWGGQRKPGTQPLQQTQLLQTLASGQALNEVP